MSKPGGALQASVRIVFLILMGFLTLFLGLLFMMFFIPVLGYYVWSLLDRTRELERKLAEKEKPAP